MDPRLETFRDGGWKLAPGAQTERGECRTFGIRAVPGSLQIRISDTSRLRSYPLPLAKMAKPEIYGCTETSDQKHDSKWLGQNKEASSKIAA